MKLDVYGIDGQKTGEAIELADAIFAAPVSKHAVYLAVKAYQANQRQGTHATKNRSAVRGGGKKPWKQKGRGVARAGTIRSPLWVGGGRIFGPEPHGYEQKVNKKVKRLAKRSLIATRLKEEQMKVLDDFKLEQGKTREMVDILANFETSKKRVLILLDDFDQMIFRASRNIPYVQVTRADLVSAYDLINSDCLLVQKSAVPKLEEVLS